MTTSVTFDLINALVDTFTAAISTANVLDGYGFTDDPGDYVMVGIDDPDGDRAMSADAQQQWAGIGAKNRDETGTITCAALSWDGGNDVRAVRAKCKAITTAVENALRANPNLGGVVPGLLWVGYGTRTQVNQLQAEDGVAVICTFDIAFKARI